MQVDEDNVPILKGRSLRPKDAATVLVIRRAGAGLARVGSFYGHGSGDTFLGFTTANRVPHDGKADILPMRAIAEGKIDLLFEAAAEATQEAVLDALAAAPTTVGRAGHVRPGLADSL